MQNKGILKIFALLCIIGVMGSTAPMAADKQEVLQIVQQLSDSDRKIWTRAVDKLTLWIPGKKRGVKEEFAKDERIRSALISRFKEESEKEGVGEGHAEAYSLLASLVASLKNPKAIPTLLDNIANSEVEEYLAETKDKRILEKMLRDVKKQKYPGKRARAIKIMARMYNVGNANKLAQKKIKAVLRRALNDSNGGVRIWAVRGIAQIGDSSAALIIKKLQQHDEYSYEIDASARGRKKGEKITVYPVREAAQKVLSDLKKRQTKKEDKEDQQRLQKPTTGQQ